MRKGPGETYREQASKLYDMAKKWLKGCTTVDELLDAVVKEQLVDTLPQALKVWVNEREPSSSKEAGELADSYLQARGIERGGAGGGERVPVDRGQPYPRKERVEEAEKVQRNSGDRGYQREQEGSGKGGVRGHGNVKCYNCSKTGHLSRNCPEKALYSRSRENYKTCRQADRAVLHSRLVEGNKVHDIVLDTGCSRTMIRKDLVPTTKMLDDAVMVQCAHGDTVAYPLAVVELIVDSLPLTVEAALSDTLPTAVLLGRDVPELNELLGRCKVRKLQDTPGKDEAMMVTTRYGASKRRELEEELQEQRVELQVQSEAENAVEGPKQATELEAVLGDAETERQDQVQDPATVLPEDPWKDGLDDELLEGGRTQRRMTRAEKCQERRKWWHREDGTQDLNFGAAELRQLQQTEYATLAAPLTELTKKDKPNCLVWSSECAEAFEALKRHLCTSPVLKCPDFERPFVLQTDASDWGVGAVLSQMDEDDNEHPVAYFSKKLLPRERRYSTVEKECLAIKLATHAFRVYLLEKPFTVQTDHHALEWLDRLKEDNARLTRWSLALQPSR